MNRERNRHQTPGDQLAARPRHRHPGRDPTDNTGGFVTADTGGDLPAAPADTGGFVTADTGGKVNWRRQ